MMQEEKQPKIYGGSRSLRRRCSGVMKEHRGRFYILRRCIIMLVCWKDYEWPLAWSWRKICLSFIFIL